MTIDSLVELRSAEGDIPVVCVPAASGSPYCYGPLANVLAGWPVYGLEAPGLQDDRPPVSSVENLANGYDEAMRHAGLGQPVSLLGWSMGAVIAVELARLITARGGEVGALCLVDPPPPMVGEVPTEAEIARRFVQDLIGPGSMPSPLEAIPGLDGGERQPERVIAAYQRAGFIPADLELDFLWPRYEVFQASVTALARYELATSYPGPATVVRASATPLSASRGQGLSGPVQEHVVSGDHYSIIMGDGLPALAAIISDRLRQVTQISDARPVQPRAGSSMEPARRLRGGAPRYPTS